MDKIKAYPLQNRVMQLSVLNLGCITQDWRISHAGRERSVVLGYENPADYARNPYYMGVIAGRVANRISGARFDLDGETHHLTANEGTNQLHGGAGGVHNQFWQVERDAETTLRLTHCAPHGAEGFPGTAQFQVTITLLENTLTYDMRATVDRPTPINLAQHNYYNLMGHGDIWGHTLHVPADHFVKVNAQQLPTGEISPVTGQNFDHRSPRTVAQADPSRHGSDISYVTATPGGTATLTAPDGLRLQMRHDQPGLQLYTGGGLAPHARALPGQSHAAFTGLALEPQGLPDAVNHPHFPSIICTPGQPYHQVLRLQLDATA